MKTKRGFTLIETILYIALLALIMSGAVFATYNIIEGAGRLDANAVIQEEGNFVVRKIDWALSSASSFSILSPRELFVTHYDGTTIHFKFAGTEVAVSENGNPLIPITTSNVIVKDVVFIARGTQPAGVNATLTIGTMVFSTTKYLRK